jgi:hypothetical protein
VTLAGNLAQISCQLYQSYFGERLSPASWQKNIYVVNSGQLK